MTDFSWFRLGQRSATLSAPRSSTSPERDQSRVTSQMSLASRSSFPPRPLTGNSDASLYVREQDQIWYNPSLDQMVETLQVAIMTRGILQQIPTEYNSYILHLIEGFADAQERTRKVDTARAEAECSLEHHLEHFKLVADEWLERECQYKTEIKRLEVLLSRTSRDGLEAVTLARTNSVIDRSGPQAKQFVSKLKRLSTSNAQDASTKPPSRASKSKSKPVAKVLDAENDFFVSEKIRRHDAAANARMTRAEDRRPRHTRVVAPRPSKDVLSTDWKVTKPTAPAQDMQLHLLFSKNVSNVTGVDETPARQEESTPQEKQTSPRNLEDLLDYEVSQGSDKDASPQLSTHGRSSSNGLNQAPSDLDIHDLDFRHLRGLSGFSFVAGDDNSPVLIGSRADDETVAGVFAGKGDDNSIELWQYGHNDQVEHSTGQADDKSVPSLATPLMSWENRWLPSSETAGPQGSSTSSVDTVIRGRQRTKSGGCLP
ncbi:hypothetical protein F4804DRAFT_121290 [Jackrogersella minutella]|nr:hypothetical protein F4804DRAFT_121290 [Jackrogersella minutella]